MPQPNDAELTRLFTASTGTAVEDSEPNTGAPSAPPTATFDLILEAVAGNVVGNSGGNYKLDLTCIDEVLAAPNGSMSFTFDQEFKPGDGWDPSGTNFVKTQTIPVTVQVAPSVRGHTFHYECRLVDAASNIVTFIDSNTFILV